MGELTKVGVVGRKVLQIAEDLRRDGVDRPCSYCGQGAATEDGRCAECNRRIAAEQRSSRLAEAGIPKRYVAAVPADIDALTWRRVTEWIEADGWALVLLGPTGCGKSHLAAAAMAYLADQPGNMLWASVPVIVDRLKNWEKSEELMARLTGVTVLVLDDLAAERLTDFGLDRVATLVQARYDACRRTIVTTNLEATALGELHGRMASRLLGVGDGARVIKLSGSDRRVKRARGQA